MSALFELDAIGTHWEIETREPLHVEVRSRILARTHELDATYSRFRGHLRRVTARRSTGSGTEENRR